ncbi:MAG: hypothetical protein PHO27_10225 [Sulfuricurvum sp.]|nr:hypothetical protein [Sulfuricurvum sp.]
MKNIFDPSRVVLTISLFFIVIATMWLIQIKSELSEVIIQRDMQVQAYENLTSLKERWGNTPDIQHKIENLLENPGLTRQDHKQNGLVLEFSNLSQNEFDRILSTLMNTPFVIKKLSLQRNAEIGMISVEIEL